MKTLTHHRFLALAVLTGVLSALFTSLRPAYAHSPHDPIQAAVVARTEDGAVVPYVIVYGHLKSSTDGFYWTTPGVGLLHRDRLKDIAISPNYKIDGQIAVISHSNEIFISIDFAETWRDKSFAISSLDTEITNSTSAHLEQFQICPNAKDAEIGVLDSDGNFFVSGTDDTALWSAFDHSGGHPATADAARFFPTATQLLASQAASGPSTLYGCSQAGWYAVPYRLPSEVGVVTSVMSAPVSSSTQYFAGTDTGAILMADGAPTAEGHVVFRRIGAVDEPIADLAISPRLPNDKRLCVSTKEIGVFCSEDLGQTWMHDSEGLTTHPQAVKLGSPHFSDLAMVVDTEGRTQSYLAGFDGLFHRSTDSGKWEQIQTRPSHDITSVAVHPAYEENGELAVGTYNAGAYVSHDRGKNWTPISHVDVDEHIWLAHYTQSESDPRLVFGANHGFLEAASTGAPLNYVPARPQDEARAKAKSFRRGLADGNVVDWAWWQMRLRLDRLWGDRLWGLWFPTAIATMDIGTTRAAALVATRRQGIWYYDPEIDEWQRVTELSHTHAGIAASPSFQSDGTAFALVRASLLKTTDGAATWAPVDQAFERAAPFYAVYGRPLAVSPDFANDQTVFAGSRSGLFRSEDVGDTWIQTLSGPILSLALSRGYAQDQIILVGLRGSGTYRSDDGGHSFERMSDICFEQIVMASRGNNDSKFFGLIDGRLYQCSYEACASQPLILPVRYEEGNDAVVIDGEWSYVNDLRLSAGRGARLSGPHAMLELRFSGQTVEFLFLGDSSDVRATARINGTEINTQWAKRSIASHPYRALRIDAGASGVHDVRIELQPNSGRRLELVFDAVDVDAVRNVIAVSD